MIFKLAEQFAKKYATDEQYADHFGVDPETGKGIVPEFENGDMVSYNGRHALFLTPAYWSNPEDALIQFMDKKPPTYNQIYSGGLDYAPMVKLKLVQKKKDKEMSLGEPL